MPFAHFQEDSSPSSPHFEDLNILKLEDVIEMNNILFTHNTVNNNTLVILENILISKKWIANIA